LGDHNGSGERPSTLPGGRPGPDGRPATLPGLADRGGIGAGPGDRVADRGARRDDLQNRLEGRDDVRGDRQDNRQGNRDDRQGNRGDTRSDRQDNRQDNQGDRQENRGDRQDNRHDNQGDRQDNRQDRREDWQNWADDHDWAYHDWHHGYWHGNADGWWDHLWDEHPVAGALGLTTWGLNRAAYGFGLWGYSNPYYVEPYAVGSSYIDYSQPLIVSEPYPVEVPVQSDVPVQSADVIAPSAPEPLPPGVTQPGLDAFNAARSAFYSRDYNTALSEIDQAAVAMPQDATVHEFRGLVLFALGRYQDAAAPVHAVLAVGPGWDWTTMVGLYPSVDTYTVQLRTLEKYVREHSDDAPSRFLAAYHYITTNNTEAAANRLREVTRLRPDDTVAAELLTMLAGPQGGSQSVAAAATPPDSGTTPVPAEELTGKWIASGPKGSEYQVNFESDGTFKWSYSNRGKTEEIDGVFAVDGDVLAMEPDSGGTLPARISKPAPDTLKFEPAGAPTGDAALSFRKSAS
jgi:tetratricopeptide (TPR) repeat protein